MSRNQILKEVIRDYKKYILDVNELMIETSERQIEVLLSLNDRSFG